MNERIRELAEQCTRHQSYWMTIDDQFIQLSEHAEVFDKEKFAELIVRECARVADDSNQLKNRPVGLSVGDVVLKNFGVIND